MTHLQTTIYRNFITCTHYNTPSLPMKSGDWGVLEFETLFSQSWGISHIVLKHCQT